jgi:hypothetical protein
MTDAAAVPRHLDGNVLGGPLRDLFVDDVTVALIRCVGCGRRATIAQLEVYHGGPGAVARCAGCRGVVLRYARTPTALHLDMRGTIAITVPIDPSSPTSAS